MTKRRAFTGLICLILMLGVLASGGCRKKHSGNSGGPAADTLPPSIPQELTAVPASDHSISLVWNASSDNVAVRGYRVYNQTILISDTSSTITHYIATGLGSSTYYTYFVTAYDAAGNVSAKSVAATASTFATGVTDTTPPTTPSNLFAAAVSPSQINVTWTASTDTDNLGTALDVAGYEIYRKRTSDAQVTLAGTIPGTSFADTGLAPATAYAYYVRAFDGAYNLSAPSNLWTAQTFSGDTADTTPPTAPTNVQVTVISDTQIDISWDPAADPHGVAHYDLYRNNVRISSLNSIAYTDTGLVPNTTYTYMVKAVDGFGRSSSASDAVTVTTPPFAGPPWFDGTLVGAWIVDQGGSITYLISNGAGTITESGFLGTGTPAGAYQVQTDGAFTLTLSSGSGSVLSTMTGTILTPMSATLSGPTWTGTLTKISDRAECEGIWSGNMTETAGGTAVLPISFSVDATGAVKSFSGLTGPISGKLYCPGGRMVSTIRTGETGSYAGIRMIGTLSDASLTGTYTTLSGAVSGGVNLFSRVPVNLFADTQGSGHQFATAGGQALADASSYNLWISSDGTSYSRAPASIFYGNAYYGADSLFYYFFVSMDAVGHNAFFKTTAVINGVETMPSPAVYVDYVNRYYYWSLLTITSPANNGTNVPLTPVFSWSPVSGADAYVLSMEQIPVNGSPSGDAALLLRIKVEPLSTSWTLGSSTGIRVVYRDSLHGASLQAGTGYKIKIFAVDAAGTMLGVKEIRFTTL